MIPRSTFFKLAVTGVLIFGVIVFTLNYISYNQNLPDFDTFDDLNGYVASNGDGDALIRIKADVKSNSKPAMLDVNDDKIDVPKVHIRTYMISMNHEQDQNVLVRKAGESSFIVLLLHDQSLSSQTWQKLGTLQYLASWGYQALAVDLPGYGNSSLPVVQEAVAVQWLIKLVRALRLSNFVIISPSRSGRFSIPYVLQRGSMQQALRGFVPIAPVVTKQFDTAAFKLVTIPTLIVHGENDTTFQSAVETLKQIPNSEVLVIKNASHACYVQRPTEFHNGLRQFLYTVYRPVFIEQYKQRSAAVITTTTLSSSMKLNMTKLTENQEKKRKSIIGNTTTTIEQHQHVH